jgi:hypothetical protein
MVVALCETPKQTIMSRHLDIMPTPICTVGTSLLSLTLVRALPQRHLLALRDMPKLGELAIHHTFLDGAMLQSAARCETLTRLELKGAMLNHPWPPCIIRARRGLSQTGRLEDAGCNVASDSCIVQV